MTLEELKCKFLKAHILMGTGVAIGTGFAEMHGLRYPFATGLLTGLLLSIHIYRKCILVLIDEYKQLKTKKNEKNENIS